MEPRRSRSKCRRRLEWSVSATAESPACRRQESPNFIQDNEMKKLFNFVAAVFAVSVVLAGCSKNEEKTVRQPSENIDSSTWIDNLIDGKAAAEKEDKKIFLFFSGDEQDQSSAELKGKIFNLDGFISEMTKKYVLVNLDFSNSLFDKASADPLASEEEKAEAAALWVKLEENMRDAGLYNIQATPSFFILTKEGYVIKELFFDQKPQTVDEVFKALDLLADEIAEYDNLLASARSGKADDRLAAINRLFEKTEPQLRYLLSDFCEEYIKLDKKNSTGMVGTYVIALANSRAVQHYFDQDALAASEEFANAAKSKFLTPEEKQQVLYTAGYLYANSGTDDAEKIKDYLQKAYDAAPESVYAQSILSMIRMIEADYADGGDLSDPEVSEGEENAEAPETQPSSEPQAPAGE